MDRFAGKSVRRLAELTSRALARLMFLARVVLRRLREREFEMPPEEGIQGPVIGFRPLYNLVIERRRDFDSEPSSRFVHSDKSLCVGLVVVKFTCTLARQPR